jgi:hypothetical protein
LPRRRKSRPSPSPRRSSSLSRSRRRKKKPKRERRKEKKEQPAVEEVGKDDRRTTVGEIEGLPRGIEAGGKRREARTGIVKGDEKRAEKPREEIQRRRRRGAVKDRLNLQGPRLTSGRPTIGVPASPGTPLQPVKVGAGEENCPEVITLGGQNQQTRGR